MKKKTRTCNTPRCGGIGTCRIAQFWICQPCAGKIMERLIALCRAETPSTEETEG
jgi:hypothetical protein